MPLGNLSQVEFAATVNSYNSNLLNQMKESVYQAWVDKARFEKFIEDSGTQYVEVMGTNGAGAAVANNLALVGSFVDAGFASGLIMEKKADMGSRVAQAVG